MEKIYVIIRDGKAVGAYTTREYALQMVALFKEDRNLREYDYDIQEVKIWL